MERFNNSPKSTQFVRDTELEFKLKQANSRIQAISTALDCLLPSYECLLTAHLIGGQTARNVGSRS